MERLKERFGWERKHAQRMADRAQKNGKRIPVYSKKQIAMKGYCCTVKKHLGITWVFDRGVVVTAYRDGDCK